jgi:hypothetical protein
MPAWMNVVKNNLKLVAVGSVAVLVAGTGAAATTVSLTGSESDVPADAVVVASPSPSPSSFSTVSDTSTVGIEPEAGDPTASPSATPTTGIRPTDTHGYCVSTAVHAATATAGINLGAAKSAAAHSCPKPGHAPKKAHAPKPAKTHPAKPEHATQHGKPAADKPRGKSGAHRP